MPMPDPMPDHTTRSTSDSGAGVPTRRPDAHIHSIGTTSPPTRTTRAVTWLGWHLGELSTVALPAGAAAATSPWLLVVSALAGLRWGVHEWRTRHNLTQQPTTDEHGKSGKDGEPS